MAEKKYNFTPGKSGNPQGRPKGTGKKISALRGILNKLKKMDQEAIDTIQKSLTEGATVDKDKVQTAKWVITTITTVHRACLSEEEAKALKDEDETPTADSGNADTTEDEVDRSKVENVFSIELSKKG